MRLCLDISVCESSDVCVWVDACILYLDVCVYVQMYVVLVCLDVYIVCVCVWYVWMYAYACGMSGYMCMRVVCLDVCVCVWCMCSVWYVWMCLDVCLIILIFWWYLFWRYAYLVVLYTLCVCMSGCMNMYVGMCISGCIMHVGVSVCDICWYLFVSMVCLYNNLWMNEYVIHIHVYVFTYT